MGSPDEIYAECSDDEKYNPDNSSSRLWRPSAKNAKSLIEHLANMGPGAVIDLEWKRPPCAPTTPGINGHGVHAMQYAMQAPRGAPPMQDYRQQQEAADSRMMMTYQTQQQQQQQPPLYSSSTANPPDYEFYYQQQQHMQPGRDFGPSQQRPDQRVSMPPQMMDMNVNYAQAMQMPPPQPSAYQQHSAANYRPL